MTPSADASPTMAGATRRMRPLLGTLVEIGLLPAAGVDAAAVQGTIDLAFAEIGTAHRRWSFHEPDSELSRLNAAAGQWLPVSSATRRLLRLCRRMMLGSEGAFDITLGGRLVREGVLPWHANTTPLPDGNCDDVEIAGTAVRLRRPIALCLDGVAKGFAVDLAIAAIRRHLRDELRGGWVNAGGDLRCFGDVELPVLQRGTDDRPVALGELRDGAVASSRVSVQGSAQRDDFPGQIRGRGGAVPYAGVWTVLARYAWRADALTKVAANTAPASRQRMVARLGGQLLEVAA